MKNLDESLTCSKVACVSVAVNTISFYPSDSMCCYVSVPGSAHDIALEGILACV